MKQWDGEIWLSMPELTGLGFSENTLWKGILRNSPIWFAVPDPQDRRKRLIRYSSMAPKYQQLVKSQLCGGMEPMEWCRYKQYEAEADEKLERRDTLAWLLEDLCETGYTKYGYLYRTIENAKQKRCLSRSAGVIDVTADYYLKNKIALSKYETVKAVCSWLKVHEDRYFPKKYVPMNHLIFMAKMKEYIGGKELNEVIFLPRSGEKATKKGLNDDFWKSVAINLRIGGSNPSARAIHRKIVQVAAMEERVCPSESTVCNFLRENEVITIAHHTDLNNQKRQKHRASMPVQRSLFPDECWEMDGTRVQLMPHLTGNKTKSGGKEMKSLYIVAVRDVYSGSFLGYWYGYNEGENAYRMALKMAVDLTGRLPYEIRHDKFPGHNTPGWEFLAETLQEKHGVKMTKTSVATGKAPMERAFGVMQQVFESDRSAWIGQGIRASVAHARPTEQYINKQFKALMADGWKYDNAVIEHMDVVSAYNHTKYSDYSKKYAKLEVSPWDMYQQAAEESKGRQIGQQEIAELFWNARKERVFGGRIEFTDRGTKHTYVIPVSEYELITSYEGASKKVVVRHEPRDFSSIMVFTESGGYLADLKETGPISIYGPDADWKAVAEYKENQKAIENRKAADLKQYALPESLAHVLPTLASKTRANDAQTEYFMRNRPDQTPEPSRKPQKAPAGTEDEIDIAAYVLSQIGKS